MLEQSVRAWNVAQETCNYINDNAELPPNGTQNRPAPVIALTSGYLFLVTLPSDVVQHL